MHLCTTRYPALLPLLRTVLPGSYRSCPALARCSHSPKLPAMASSSHSDNEREQQGVEARSAQESAKQADKPNRQSPDHFVAVQIPAKSAVLQCISDVQASLVSHDAALQGTLVDACTAHLTLFVCRLHTPERMHAAKAALAAAETELGSHGQGQGQDQALSLAFRGLGHFRHQVLYVDVVHDEGLAQLQSVSAAIATKFREADLLGHEEGQEFTAHLTVAKLSALRRQGNRRRSAVKKLPQAAYEGFKELDGGSCSFSELQLCSMQGRQAGSYYPVVTTICIGGKAANQHEP